MLAGVHVSGVVSTDLGSESLPERAHEVAVLIYVAGRVTVRGMRRLLILIALVALGAGCGGHVAKMLQTVKMVTVTTTESETSSSFAARDCTVFERGSSVYVDVFGADASSVCQQIIQEWSGSATFWSPIDDYTGRGVRSTVCNLSWNHNTMTIMIGSQSDFVDRQDAYGFCGLLVNHGAVEMPLP